MARELTRGGGGARRDDGEAVIAVLAAHFSQSVAPKPGQPSLTRRRYSTYTAATAAHATSTAQTAHTEEPRILLFFFYVERVHPLYYQVRVGGRISNSED